MHEHSATFFKGHLLGHTRIRINRIIKRKNRFINLQQIIITAKHYKVIHFVPLACMDIRELRLREDEIGFLMKTSNEQSVSMKIPGRLFACCSYVVDHQKHGKKYITMLRISQDVE